MTTGDKVGLILSFIYGFIYPIALFVYFDIIHIGGL